MNNQTHQPNENVSSSETVTGTFTRLAPWTLGARLFVMVMAIIATSVLTRTMTKQEWNDYSLLKNMWWFVWLLGQMGLSEAALRFGAELSARGDVRGFRRLVAKMLFLQCLAIAGMLVFFVLLHGWLDAVFSARFGFALIMMVILGGVTIFKETLRQGYVAAYWIKLIALMSAVGAVAFPLSSYIYIKVFRWGVVGGLAGEATGYALMLLVFAVGLPYLKFKRTMPEDAPHEPVTNYRIFRYSGAIVSNHAMTLVFFGEQVTVFLVGYFLSSQRGAAGIYNLASTIPKQGLAFFTLAIIPLVMAMFTKAYYRDKSSLPELLRSYYKLMIIMIMPLVAVGLLFLDNILEFLSGERGIEAGGLATALLPLQLSIILIIPIAAGMNVLERAHRLIVPRIFVGIGGVGLMALSLHLWPDLRTVVMAGYVKAIVGTVIVMPLAVRLVGGFYFPYRFFGRVVLACLPVALLYPLRFLWPYAKSLGLSLVGKGFAGEAIYILGVGVLSAVLLTVSARLTGLFGPDEMKYFRNARFPGINLLTKILVRKRHRTTV